MGQGASNEELKAFGERGEFWTFTAVSLLLTLFGFILAINFVGPPPPKTLRVASGPDWGAYYRFAQEYRDILMREGLTLEVIATQGSSENLRLLSSGEADIAFVQGGMLPTSTPGSPVLEALGSVYYEPIWLFVRGDKAFEKLSDLEGQTMAIGPDGSGTRVIALELLGDADLLERITEVPVGGEAAEQMLYNGEVDSVFFVGSPGIPAINRLLKNDGITLMQIDRAKAYERRHQFLSVIPLYQGVVDLALNIPERDIELLALSATLVVTEDFHKALPAVILNAAREVHGSGTILSENSTFPSPHFCSFPLSRDAKHYYDYGTSFLYRHLPFYWASAFDRMAILLLPLLGLTLPIIRLLPPFYNLTMKSKIYRRYLALQKLEAQLERKPFEELVQELDKIEQQAKLLSSMPPWFGADIFALRTNLERVRDRLLKLRTGPIELKLETVDKSGHRKRSGKVPDSPSGKSSRKRAKFPGEPKAASSEELKAPEKDVP